MTSIKRQIEASNGMIRVRKHRLCELRKFQSYLWFLVGLPCRRLRSIALVVRVRSLPYSMGSFSMIKCMRPKDNFKNDLDHLISQSAGLIHKRAFDLQKGTIVTSNASILDPKRSPMAPSASTVIIMYLHV